MIIPDIWARAKKETVYLLDATSTWDSTTSHKIIVPTGYRWKVIVVTMKNDASQASSIYWLDSADVVIAQLATQGANTTRTTWPNTAASVTIFNTGELIMDAGEKLHINAGGAQGAGAYIYVHYLEVKT